MQEETLLKRRPSHKCTSVGLDVALSAADGWARASDGGAGREKSECVNGSEWRVVVLESVDGGRWTVDGQLCADTMLWFRFRGNKLA